MSFSDSSDHASEVEDRLKEYELQRIRQARNKASSMPPSGYCYYCSSSVATPKLWCDSDCREDWERLEKMKRIEGKR